MAATDMERLGAQLHKAANRPPQMQTDLLIRPGERWDDPPNLSISVGGGRENNSDCPSNGE